MISREQLVTNSVVAYAVSRLAARGYTEGADYDLAERFPGKGTTLARPIVAVGFNFDDEGHAAEMGSDLRVRTYTIEFWVFGTTNTWAANLANHVKFDLERDGGVPLLDENDDEVDRMDVDGVSSQREEAADPEPWQEFVWTTHLRVEDYYYSTLV